MIQTLFGSERLHVTLGSQELSSHYQPPSAPLFNPNHNNLGGNNNPPYTQDIFEPTATSVYTD